jgi:hypothetical protein
MKPWKKLLLYLGSLTGALFTGLIIVLACAGEMDPYDYYTSFFHATIQGKKDYNAFYFTDYQFTYGDTEPASEAAINSAEWATYLGTAVKPKEVQKVIYGLDSAGKTRLSQFLDQDLPLTDSLAGNSFLTALKDPAHDAALQYYRFALEMEPLANQAYNEWDPAPVDTAGLTTAAQKALETASTVSDEFLKLRYYYQAQRFMHIGKSYEQAREIYNQHIANITSKSHVKGWALSCKAGEDRWLGDTTKAAYLFSKVFTDYPERRLQAYRNYHYINPPFSDVLKLAGEPEEKASLYAIKGFANPEIETDDLEQAYNQAPSSPIVGVLLVREVNKMEENYLTPALANNTDEAYSAQLNQKAGDLLAPAAAKWPLYVGIVILVAGILVLVWTIKKHPEKLNGKIAGGVLIAAGIIGIVWFAVGRFKNKGPEGTSLPQGSFFVAMPDSVKARYDAHIEKLKNFCTKLANDEKYKEPQIGLLVNAYLSFMQNKADDGLNSLSKMDDKSLSPALSDQKQIVKLLLSAQRLKQVKAVDEAALLPLLKWLDGKVVKTSKYQQGVYSEISPDYDRFATTERNFYTYVLAPAYLRQGDTVKASLALLKSQNGSTIDYRNHMFKQLPDFWYNYLHSASLKQIIYCKKSRPTDAYLSFLSNGLKNIDYGHLYELLGTIQLREHQYQAALASFRMEKSKSSHKARAEEESIARGNSFDAAINDYPQPTALGFNKLQFAERMAKLEAQLKDNPKNANTYFQMATGIYNTSTYAGSWIMISYMWSSYDFGRKSMYYYDADYVKTSFAKQYYLKARELSDDPEFKAKCTFMAAKCEQKNYEAPSYTADYDSYEKSEKAYLKSLKHNNYFQEFQQYKNTAFYRKAADECSYLSDFIAGK